MLGVQRQPTLNEASLSLGPPSGRYVLVSRRCRMIYVSSKQLREIITRESINVDDTTLSDAVLLYPSDLRICRHVADVERFNAVKKNWVEELVIEGANEATLRNFRLSDG